MLYILPDGRTATGSQAPAGIGPAPDYLPLSARPTTFFRPALPGSLSAIRAGIAVEAFALLLAIILISAGVRTLGGSPGAVGMHVLWAIAKIVFCFIALAIGMWWSSTMIQSRYGMAPFLAKGMGMSVVSLIYPGVVLAVMNSAAVRDYYRSIGEPMWLFSPQRRAAWRLEVAESIDSSFGRAILWTIATAAAIATVVHLFAAVYALTDGGSGRTVVARSGEHLVAIILTAGCVGAAIWLMKWSQRARRSVIAAFPGFEGGEA
jgi:hypothetical protein